MIYLYSVVFELRVSRATTISGATRHLTHALFLNFIRQFNLALSASLHNLPGPKPFTISALLGVEPWLKTSPCPGSKSARCGLRCSMAGTSGATSARTFSRQKWFRYTSARLRCDSLA